MIQILTNHSNIEGNLKHIMCFFIIFGWAGNEGYTRASRFFIFILGAYSVFLYVGCWWESNGFEEMRRGAFIKLRLRYVVRVYNFDGGSLYSLFVIKNVFLTLGVWTLSNVWTAFLIWQCFFFVNEFFHRGWLLINRALDYAIKMKEQNSNVLETY